MSAHRTRFLVALQALGTLIVTVAVWNISGGWHAVAVIGVSLVYGAQWHLIGHSMRPRP